MVLPDSIVGYASMRAGQVKMFDSMRQMEVYQQQQNAFNQINAYSTSAHYIPSPYDPPILSEEDIRRIVREELETRSVVDTPSDHAHFMIQGLREDYCMCGHKVRK